MTNELFSFIKELTELVGPVGQEGVVLDHVEALWRADGMATERTRIGNVVGRAGGAGRKLLLIAHADELCYLVRSIDEHGFLWLANGQVWERKTSLRNWFAVGQPVHVLAHDWGSAGMWEYLSRSGASDHVASFTSISGPSADHLNRFIIGNLKRPYRPRRCASHTWAFSPCQCWRRWLFGCFLPTGCGAR